MMPPGPLKHACCTAAFLLAAVQVLAQSNAPARVEILGAQRLEFDDRLATGAQRLIGEVRLKHADAWMQCDSAYVYADQRVSAFGHVGIRQGDSLHLRADHLEYVGAERRATLTGNVVLSDPGMTLTTDALSYDLRTAQAQYVQGARIEGRRDGNVLSSRKGLYVVAACRFTFSGDVRIDHPERTITADTLQYETAAGRAQFLGPTHIEQDGTHLYCERGAYDTRQGKGWFTKAGRIRSHGRTLTGDSLYYERATGLGMGWGHVQLADTANDLLVRGDLGVHRELEGRSMITGQAELLMPLQGDTLHLHADTLFAVSDSGGRHVLARRNVRFFKSDLQGVCGTMLYSTADSLVRLLDAPLLWSGNDQLSGDSMRVAIGQGKPLFAVVDGSGFAAAPADSARWNQAAGTVITARFTDGKLRSVTADGNARTAYYAREGDGENGPITYFNRTDCASILLRLDSGAVRSVSFIGQPDATLWPIEDAPPDAFLMEGFGWFPALRPVDRTDIFRKTPLRPPAAGPMPK
jgi:lipopolysaccharide export system protein LptA